MGTAAFAAEVERLIAETPATVGAVVALPDGQVLFEHQAGLAFESASLYKLGIMVELYRKRERGELSFDDTVVLQPAYFVEGADAYGYGDLGAAVPVSDLLWAMINVSSNVASHALLAVTGSANINATMASLGLSETVIRWDPPAALADMPAPEPEPSPKPTPTAEPAEEAEIVEAATATPTPEAHHLLDDGMAIVTPHLLTADAPEMDARQLRADAALNATTPADMARLFQLLLAGQVVSPAASQEMLDLMAGQLINDRFPARLPAGTRVDHKTGNLDGLLHDAGVIYTPGGPVVVVVMADQIQSHYAVVQLMQTIALLAYELYA